MTFIKYLLSCILDFFDLFSPPTVAPWKGIIIGFIELAVIAASFIVSFVFLNWYFALIITIGGIIVFCLLSIVIELIIDKIKASKKKQ